MFLVAGGRAGCGFGALGLLGIIGTTSCLVCGLRVS